MQLASGDQHTSRAVIIVSEVRSLALNPGVYSIGDRLIRAQRLVLLDERGRLTVVAHPRHKISKTRAASGREVDRLQHLCPLGAARARRLDVRELT